MEHKLTKEERFDRIYRSYSNDIYKVCLYFVKKEDVAQDIMQQTFVNFYDHFETIDPDYMFPYLVRTAKNLVYDRQRLLKRETPTEFIYEEAHIDELASESLEDDYLQRWKRSCKKELCNNILERLHEEQEGYYKIFILMFFYNKSYDEIALELGITKEMLYARIYRAKRWIRRYYQTDFENLMEMI